MKYETHDVTHFPFSPPAHTREDDKKKTGGSRRMPTTAAACAVWGCTAAVRGIGGWGVEGGGVAPPITQQSYVSHETRKKNDTKNGTLKQIQARVSLANSPRPKSTDVWHFIFYVAGNVGHPPPPPFPPISFPPAAWCMTPRMGYITNANSA